MNWKQIFQNATLAWVVAFCCLAGGAYIAFKGIKLPEPVPIPAPGMPYLSGNRPEGFALGSLAKLRVELPKELPPGFIKHSVILKLLEVKLENGIPRLVEKTDVDMLPDGSFIFGTGIEQRELICQAYVTFLGKDTDVWVKNFILMERVKLGTGPLPPPGPDPLPPVDPTFEEGRFGLAKFSYDAVKNTIKDKKKEGAKAISDSMQSLASAVAAGAIKSPESLLTKAFENNNAALSLVGINPVLWDEFFTKIQDRLFQLYQEKKLNVIEDYRVAFLEIVIGLNAVK